MTPETLLGRMDARTFLDRHWQRLPLLVRGALPGFVPPISADELAGLALEEEVESRLVIRDGDRWTVRHGPFEEQDLAGLPARGWTLLVQAVDQHVPEVRALLELFSFLPRWRFDDVMISIAPDGGGVGPHLDDYDVFLIQAAGRRRWRWERPRAGTGSGYPARRALVPDQPLKLLQSFEPAEEAVLGPGDMLYLPPGVGHDGVAVGVGAMTISIGFRAPSVAELASALAGRLFDAPAGERRFADPARPIATARGEIRREDAERALRLLIEALAEETVALDLLGRQATLPKYDHLPEPPTRAPSVPQLRKWVKNGQYLYVSSGSRLAYLIREGGSAILFADGRSWTPGPAEAALLIALADHERADATQLAAALSGPEDPATLLALLAAGTLVAGPEP